MMVRKMFSKFNLILNSVIVYRRKAGKLALDGLPFGGARITVGDPIYCFYDHEKEAYTGELS